MVKEVKKKRFEGKGCSLYPPVWSEEFKGT
jgi:hypothetical protein